ncbi:hypothetical protein ACH47Z_24760 [Streptomyces sp. NPDC020192]
MDDRRYVERATFYEAAAVGKPAGTLVRTLCFTAARTGTPAWWRGA